MIKRKLCSEEGCDYPVWSKGKCKRHHAIYNPDKYRVKQSRTRIKPRSDKRKKQEAEYKIERALYLKDHPECEAKISGCAKGAKEIHHLRGRIGELLANPKYFLAVCRNCHTWIENNPIEAKELGFSLSRLAK